MIKLWYVVGSILTNVLFKGFCQAEEEGEKQGEGPGEGTGVGEGKGQENKSKDMEFDEQMGGLQGEEEENDGDYDFGDDGYDMD